MNYARNTGGGTTSDGQLDALTDLVGAALDGAEDALLAATLDGRGYLCSTGMVDVPSGESIYATIENPAGSGVNIVLLERWFDNNRASGQTPLEYLAYPAPTADLANNSPPVNLTLGGAASSAVFEWQNGTVDLGGPTASSSPLPTGGFREYLRLPLIIGEGRRLGFRIDGGGQNLSQAARVGITFVFYEVAL